MSKKRTVKKVCTKDYPFVPPRKDDEHWIHPDVYDKNPESDSSIAIFHCPNCGIDIEVDMRS